MPPVLGCQSGTGGFSFLSIMKSYYDRNRAIDANISTALRFKGDWFIPCGGGCGPFPYSWFGQAVSLIFLLLFLSPGVSLGQFLETNYNNGTLTAQRTVVLRCNTFPAAKTIHYYNGFSWQDILVGPGRGDLTLTYTSQRPLRASYAYTGNVGPAGVERKFTVPGASRILQFAMTVPAKVSGPYVNCHCMMDETEFTIRYGTGSGSSGLTWDVTPPVYLTFISHEGDAGLMTDNGGPPDNDQDGIPDSLDPDDDNDGRPDTSDDFPNDPDEKDDYDNDGTGDNEDLDDDNDGTPDLSDKFPNNSEEDKDTDGDGIGDNQDPQPNTPPGGGRDSAGDGPSDNEGDGNGNPGPGTGGGGPGSPGTGQQPGSNAEGGDLGAPGALQGRPRSYGDKISEFNEDPASYSELPGGLAGSALSDIASSFRDLGQESVATLEVWQPFAGFAGGLSGDMTQWPISNPQFGSVVVQFPVQPEVLGPFRLVCLFAMMWGYVLAALRILKI